MVFYNIFPFLPLFDHESHEDVITPLHRGRGKGVGLSSVLRARTLFKILYMQPLSASPEGEGDESSNNYYLFVIPL